MNRCFKVEDRGGRWRELVLTVTRYNPQGRRRYRREWRLDDKGYERLVSIVQSMLNKGALHIELTEDQLGWTIWS